MSLAVRRGDTSTGSVSPHAGAVGDDARRLHEQLIEALAGLRGERHHAVRHRLIEVLAEGREAGWDGYGAEPVSVAAYVRARSLLALLPSGFPTPHVSADPDGEISFEWLVNRRRMFSVSVGCHSRAAYSALIDESSVYGTEVIDDRFPTVFADFLRRLHEEP